jgi:hypothetical protein
MSMATTKLAQADLSAALVRQALDYDPATGLLFWRSRDNVPPRVNRRFAGKPAGGPDGQYGYISVRLFDRLYQAHRLIWLHVTGKWPTEVLDHIDGNPTNNAWINLRPATRAENNRNRLAIRKNALKGTSWDPRTGRWISQIMLNKKNYVLGNFATAEEAHAAYVEAARRLHGEFARHE